MFVVDFLDRFAGLPRNLAVWQCPLIVTHGFELPLVAEHSTQTCPILKGSLPPALYLEIKEWKEY